MLARALLVCGVVAGCWLAAAAPAAEAGRKQTVAVLGLEVKGDQTKESVDAAKQVTRGLRDRVNLGTSKYELAAGSQKDLVDEKVVLCNTETAPCLTQIAADVNAQILIYGSLTPKGSDYMVSLRLFDTTTQKLTPGPVERVPSADFEKGAAKLARKLYAEVTGESAEVVLTLRIKGSSSGSIRVDGQLAGSYKNGTAVVTLPEGKVKIAIEPSERGLERYEATVTVSGPEMTKDIAIEKQKK